MALNPRFKNRLFKIISSDFRIIYYEDSYCQDTVIASCYLFFLVFRKYDGEHP